MYQDVVFGSRTVVRMIVETTTALSVLVFCAQIGKFRFR